MFRINISFLYFAWLIWLVSIESFMHMTARESKMDRNNFFYWSMVHCITLNVHVRRGSFFLHSYIDFDLQSALRLTFLADKINCKLYGNAKTTFIKLHCYYLRMHILVTQTLKMLRNECWLVTMKWDYYFLFTVRKTFLIYLNLRII